MSSDERPLYLSETARKLGVPTSWLKAEADAGRIPCLHAGGQTFFNLKAVRRSLLDRAATGSDPRLELITDSPEDLPARSSRNDGP